MGRKLRVSKAKEQVSDIEWDFLNDKPVPDSFEAVLLKFNHDGKTESLWSLHKEVILDEHIKTAPGTRPRLWWEFDAPRWLDEYRNGLFDHELPEPRKRLGGTGTPDYEVLGFKPCFAFGLPVSWVSPFDVSYYGGTLRHVVTGQLVNPGSTFTGVAIDSDDPPLYESEASYLDRHGLFLPGERKRLKKADFEPETMAYVD
jgi:hypothetical protein